MKKKQDDLKEAIFLLKKKQTVELKLLKEHMQTVKESLKPVNLIKGLFRQVTSAPEIKGDILGSIIGLATGYVSKKAFVGGSHNPITKIIGSLLQMGVSNVASNNSDSIKSIGEKLFQLVFKKSDKTALKNSISDN
jgi:hypothetical protein